jgi:CHAT domain-containing protein
MRNGGRAGGPGRRPRSVLATQWSIDESAADLIAAFYEGLAGGRPTAEALREAKLKILKMRLRLGGTDVSLAHPFFWAPFVLIGNPEERR